MHHQFTTNRPCTRCGSPSVSQSLYEVYGPHDQRLQNAPGELRRAREQIKTFVVVTFGMCGVVAFIAWLVALCMGGQLGVAIVLGAVVFLLCCATSPWIQMEYARSKARNFRESLPESIVIPPDQFGKTLDSKNDEVLQPFFLRNEIPAGMSEPIVSCICFERLKTINERVWIDISKAELTLLSDSLRKRGFILPRNLRRCEQFFVACALKTDFQMFCRIVVDQRDQRMSIFASYANQIDDDDIFLPFLRHLLAQKKRVISEESLTERVDAWRAQFALQHFEHDLEQRKNPTSQNITIEMVDAMDPYNFELLLGIIYETRGYKVIETPKSSDQGADVLIEKAGDRIVVQAKLYSSSVGNKAVQEVIGARGHFRCTKTVVVTNNEFTRSAIQLAGSNNVSLVSRSELTSMIGDFNLCDKDYVRLAELMEPRELEAEMQESGDDAFWLD